MPFLDKKIHFLKNFFFAAQHLDDGKALASVLSACKPVKQRILTSRWTAFSILDSKTAILSIPLGSLLMQP